MCTGLKTKMSAFSTILQHLKRTNHIEHLAILKKSKEFILSRNQKEDEKRNVLFHFLKNVNICIMTQKGNFNAKIEMGNIH